MNEEAVIKELEKNRRLSGRAIPIYTAFLLVAALLLFALSRFFAIPIWITLIVLSVTAFTLVGDIYNYYYYGKRLKRLKHG